MTTEETTNYTVDDNSSTVQLQKQQNDISGEQMDWTSKLLLECPEAAMNVHEYLQRNYSTQQQVFIHHTSSTPKCGPPLDESGGSTNYGSNGFQHPRKKFQQSKGKSTNKNQQATTTQWQQQLPSSNSRSGERHQITNKDVNQRNHLSFDQLKHAVSSNLPCFHIQFTGEVDRNKIPTAIYAGDLVLKELRKNGIKINQFTLIGWAGKRLKLGVNNKDDYAALVETDKWPSKINGIDVEVTKPKFVPDSFALVVRYVPQEMDEEFVTNEIQRTIASADRIKRIHYAYQRKINDYRFDVKDYQEYNAVLKLGRIGIGHSWVAVTPFFPGNRLTYCTKCWRIGHLRNKCDAAPRCRVCLVNLTNNSEHVCKNEPKCAQCDGNHHSLDNQCRIIREYKQQLKEEVEVAIKNGKLQRGEPQKQVQDLERRERDYPMLTAIDNQPTNKWNIEQNHTLCQPSTPSVLDLEKTLEHINSTLSKLLDGNDRLEVKVDQLKDKLKTAMLDVQLHQAVLLDIITTMKDSIPPLLTSSKLERVTLMPAAQQYFNRFHSAFNRLGDGFQLNRMVDCTPTSNQYDILQTNQNSPVLLSTTTDITNQLQIGSNSKNYK